MPSLHLSDTSLLLRYKIYSFALFLIGIVCLVGAAYLVSPDFFLTQFLLPIIPEIQGIFWFWSACTLAKAMFCFCASQTLVKFSPKRFSLLTVLMYVWTLSSIVLFSLLIHLTYSLPRPIYYGWSFGKWGQVVLGIFCELYTPFGIWSWIREQREKGFLEH